MGIGKIFKHLSYLIFVLWGISLGTFALFSLTPGDPAEIILRNRHEAPDPRQVDALRRDLGLEDPWLVRYGHWLGQVCSGNWGVSWKSGQPVWDEITSRIPATLELAISSFMLVIALSVISGAVAAFKKNRLPDIGIRAATIVFSAMPAYWLGLLLIYFFSMKYPLFPVAGRGTWAHLVLPSSTLAIAVGVLQGRVLRATLIQIMAMDYIRFAVSKGLSFRKIFFSHMTRNALPPMVTMWGVSLGHLLGGTVIVETVFAWPGLGRLTVDAVMARDIPLVQAIVLFSAIVFVIANQLVEIINSRLDPKIRYSR